MTIPKKSTSKSEVLFIRIEPRTLRTFDYAAEARGLTRCEATRQIIAAWLRHPESLPIGLPPQHK